MKRTFISVVIPTYNRSHLLIDSINSVLNQTHTNFELLVVDDHSTDNTKEVVEEYEDERVKYFLNTRSKGAQGARNTGLYAAKGEWIAMLDSDDAWLPEKLEKQVKYIQNCDDKVVGIATGTTIYDFETNEIINTQIPSKRVYTTNNLLYKNYLRGFSSFVFKKNTAIQLGGFDESFPALQDMDFYISLSTVGEIHTIKDSLTRVRIDNIDRISSNWDTKNEGLEKLYEKHQKKYNRSIKLRCIYNLRYMVFNIRANNIQWIKRIYWLFIAIIFDRNGFVWCSKTILRKIFRIK